jgi:hypothetical protein
MLERHERAAATTEKTKGRALAIHAATSTKGAINGNSIKNRTFAAHGHSSSSSKQFLQAARLLAPNTDTASAWGYSSDKAYDSADLSNTLLTCLVQV